MRGERGGVRGGDGVCKWNKKILERGNLWLCNLIVGAVSEIKNMEWKCLCVIKLYLCIV